MEDCKCIVPPRHGGTINSCQDTSPLMKLVAGEVGWGPLTTPSNIFPPNRVGTEQNRTVTCMMLKTKANDKRKNLALHRDEFRGP
ncbi:uncharacterized protein TNCV_3378631 [Trichonephila clavipes]|nr:uncharacterized protein TNCV_3378631 [Trichonephila clavipes]